MIDYERYSAFVYVCACSLAAASLPNHVLFCWFMYLGAGCCICIRTVELEEEPDARTHWYPLVLVGLLWPLAVGYGAWAKRKGAKP